ncbi:MAG: D-3-phosphoglycerate dehydrogenase [Chloroflexi bacterium]|jgi:D-3-phosphoglycerate dehydrogenase|nr:MAG: D-3-phosphoglycerate dehydrogenase [Chloroflexota bacterium]
MARILVADSIAAEGIELLKELGEVDVRTGLSEDEICEVIGEYDALVVRSQTKVTARVLETGAKLQVVGRAGVGVDNIDLEAATRSGIAVVNAPTGNIVAAAEHTIALMMAAARRIPQAHASLTSGQWRRSEFTGIEIRKKTLGLVGLGRVGTEVARRANGLEMHVLAYDPFVTAAHARTLDVELASFEEVLRTADYISLHTPLTEQTRGLIGGAELAMTKTTAILVNCARGELIDEQALLEAIQGGTLAGAALDVFSKEPMTESPLFGDERIIVTPHLGASTQEAQYEVSVEVAEQVRLTLEGKPARHVVNAPFVAPETHAVVAPFLDVAVRVGGLVSQLAEGRVQSIQIQYDGDIGEHDTNMLKAAVLVGIMGRTSEQRVNVVNAQLIASQRGLEVLEKKGGGAGDLVSLLTVEMVTEQGTSKVSGTVLRNTAHIVRIGEYWLDFAPVDGYLLITEHRDQPGVIGAVGTVCGRNDVNISFMEVGRLEPRGRAVMILGLDDPLADALLDEINQISGVENAQVVQV